MTEGMELEDMMSGRKQGVNERQKSVGECYPADGRGRKARPAFGW